ncbi:MAG: transcription termination factor NusA [Ignavibacteriaceae bacterium]|nr:transcription termination factor NusA [Ignavibacteriaceae bacterium]NUM69205.1 transcription termination factor NusA [Ignavibacteriaceae bacterium]
MNAEIVDSFSQMVREKGVDKDVLHGIIEDIFGIMVKKKYGEEAVFDVVVNIDRGDIEIYLTRTIVEEVEDPNMQISLEEVEMRGNEDELDIDDEYVEKIPLAAFGRRLVTLAKQSLNQKIREVEKENLFHKYKDLVNEIVIGDIYQIRKNDILVNHNKNELMLPREEQIPHEKYKKGESIRAIVKEVRRGKNGPEVIISRSDDLLLRRLFEIEVPEIYDGIIEIKAIARRPGVKAKVAVESVDKRIDAVGACIGMKGVRIHSIVRELNGENIDVINYSPDLKVLVERSLAPGKINQVEIIDDENLINVYADTDQASLIVGRQGVNIELTEKLTGYKVMLIRELKDIDELDYDVDLYEFRDELGDEIYFKLINARFDSMLEVLKATDDQLGRIEGFDEATIEKVREILKTGLQED